LVVTDNVFPNAPIITLMMEAMRSFLTAALTIATKRNIPEDSIPHNHRSENLKSNSALTGWTPQRRRNVFPVK
jgi:hypothetical protein